VERKRVERSGPLVVYISIRFLSNALLRIAFTAIFRASRSFDRFAKRIILAETSGLQVREWIMLLTFVIIECSDYPISPINHEANNWLIESLN